METEEQVIEKTITKSEVRLFMEQEVMPLVDSFDKEQYIPRSFFEKLAKKGFLGSQIPKDYGGQDYDFTTLAMIHEEFGRAYSSVQNIITVYGMVTKPLSKYGTAEQKNKWLPLIASGQIIPAIAITEPNVGSDTKMMENSATLEGDYYILNGKKKYITLGQVADLFLVAAKVEDKGVVFLIERDTPGLKIKSIKNLLGFRANMLVELDFDNCKIHLSNVLGKVGMGLTRVISYALDIGRFNTACGCIGIGKACLDASIEYVNSRKQFGKHLIEHQLIKKMITEIIVELKAARELCYSAAKARDDRDPSYINDTLIAKYYASKMVVKVSNHTLQMHGAYGCTDKSPVQRYYRDAKIMEIIEGATQMYELIIPKSWSSS